MKARITSIFSKLLVTLLIMNTFIITFVSGVLYQEHIKSDYVNQQFDLGENVLITRGYYKGCKAQVLTFDGKNEEYVVQVNGCLTRKYKPKTGEVYASQELMHILTSKMQRASETKK